MSKQKLFFEIENWLASQPKNPLLIVLGPTASGKTELAITLAQKFFGEIVNADSRQIYRELEIGTAKPSDAELAKVPHFLVSEFSPEKIISVAEYRKLAEQKIYEILKQKKLPILSGGHNLLISAIVENYQFPQKVDLNERNKLKKIYNTKNGPQKLWQELQKIAPDLAKKTAPENSVHLLRFLERAKNSTPPKKSPRKFSIFLVGLNPERKILYEKINARVDQMLEMGLLSEVKKLAQKYDRFIPALRGHGYRELLDFLAGEKNFATAVAEIKQNTRHYAKRQMTWWRNSDLFAEIFWLDNC
jgi:tRNA dimethylallyltransferase